MPASLWRARVTTMSIILLVGLCQGLSISSPYWNITGTGSMEMTAIPIHNGVPVENVIILGGTTTIIESETRNYIDTEIFRYDLSSGGSWRTITQIVTPTSTGDYTSTVPVEKKDLIWEINFGPKRLAVTISLFNDTANVTKTGGYPVPVSPQAFKVTYLLSNWTWYNSSVGVVSLDMNSNVLTDRLLDVSIEQPHIPTPLEFRATYPEKWDFLLSFERWTLVNGILDFVGDLILLNTDTSNPLTRNAKNVILSYPTNNYHSIEYDPTGLFSLFDVSQKDTQNGKGKPPYWVIGVVFGVLALVAIVALVVFKVPSVRNAVFPSRQRAEYKRNELEDKRGSSWVSSTTPSQ